MIALEQVSLTLGEFSLKDVSLHISKGEYLVIMGPSGAGKTVLLETIAGLRFPDRGRILFDGIDAGGIPPEKRRIAIVYQDYSLFPHMTAYENIAFGLKFRRVPEPETKQRVQSLLREFNISHLIDHYPSSMSGGEQQRVALARAIATDPTVLLLDEPFASLDPRNRDECIRVMQELKDTRSIAIIQVSHSGGEAYALADRLAVLIGGKVAQAGTPDEVFYHPVSPDVAQFVGMENVLTGTVADTGSGHSLLCIGSGNILLPSGYQPGSRISIGIPASCIRVVYGQPALDEQDMNIFTCLVRNVTLAKDTVTLTLEGAISLTAVMQRTDDDRQIPLQGMPVYAVFKNTDVRILSGV